MTRRLGGFRRRGFPALASLSLVSALACGGAITGCGGDDNGGGGSNQEDGGDAGDGGVSSLDASKDAAKASDAAIDATSEASTSADAGTGADTGTPEPDAEGAEEAGPDSSMTTPEAGLDAGPDSTTGGGGSDGGKEAGIVDSGLDSTVGPGIDSGIDSGIADAHVGVDANDAGSPPVASFASTTITLPNANCGATATPTNFVVNNTGGGTLTVNATVPGSVFSVTPTSASIASGQQGTFVVHAAIPAASTAGTALTGNLNITTNDTTHASASIGLSTTPMGITLKWTPTTADFGIAPNGFPDTPITLTLTNTGNVAATGLALGVPVDPESPSDTQFSVGTPSSTTVAANGGTVTVQANFLPTVTASPSSATSALTVTGAVCGTDSVTSLALSGQGGTGDVTGWPVTTVDFGQAPCGGAAPANQPFTLMNSGNIGVTIASATTGPTDPAYSTDAVGKTIPAGGQLVVNLIAPPIPQTSLVPGSYNGTLTFTTNPGAVVNTVAVTEEAQGAILALDTSQSPNFGAFGNIATGQFLQQSFNVVNSGNAPADVSIALNTPFSVASSTFTVGSGATFTNSVTYSPTDPVSSQQTLALQTSDVLCAPLPQPPISLTGQGEGGSVSVPITSLAFSANCGSQDNPKTFTISDVNGNQPFNWTIAGTDGGAIDTTFYNVSPTSGTATPDTPSIVTVTPVAIQQFPTNTAPSAFAMTLNISTDVPGDLGHQVALSETPLGDIISLVPANSPIDFGPTPVGTTSQSQSLTFQNAANPGTPAATLNFVSSDSTDFAVLNSPLSIVLGGSSNINVEFVSPALFPDAGNGEFTSTLSFSTSDPICAPLPDAVDPTVGTLGTFPIQGLATQAGPSIQPSSVNFGLVNCGATAQPQNITITNTGNQDFNISSIGLNGLAGELSDGLYSISLSGHLVVAGTGSQTITVTPSAIPGEVDVVPNFAQFSGSVLIVTDANTSPNSFTVNLNEGAQGAIVTAPPLLQTLNWTFGTVSVGQQSSFAPSIVNSGNADLLVQLVNDTTSNSVFSLASSPTDIPAEINNAPTHGTILANFRPVQPGTTSPENGHLTFSALAPGNIPSVLCAPLPPSWNAATATDAITLTGTSSGSSGP
jgi:hypothetical protein